MPVIDVNGIRLSYAVAGEGAPVLSIQAEQPSILMKRLRAMARYDAGPRLQALDSIPTLVSTATHDRIATVAYGRELARAIPGAAYVEIPDRGHGVTIQRPERINEVLAAHVSRAEALETQPA